MYPTLFTIGNLNIPTYTVLLDLGLILGLVVTYFEGKRLLDSGEIGLDVGLWTVIGGIVGGRIGYVLANWSTFAEDWMRALRIWEGGLSFHGAFLGGLLVIAVFSWVRRRDEESFSFWELCDVVTLGLAVGLVFGWAACLMSGCAYGILGEGFGFMVLPDIYGIEASRFATQVAGLIQATVLLVVFWLMRNRWPFAGAAFLMYTLLYFGGQFFLEYMRGDEALYLGGWRLTQMSDLVIALAAAVGLLVLWWRAQREGEQLVGEEFSEFDETEEPVEAEDAEDVGEAEEVTAAKDSKELQEATEADESEGADEDADITGDEDREEPEEAIEAEAATGDEEAESSEEPEKSLRQE
jgi:phosphatidylglycerol:prolipoprotein diacylglycerol transferase